MRIYDGSPRQDFEEVFRSIGAYLDRRGMRDVLLTEAPDGFIVQGLVIVESGGFSETMGQLVKETLTFLDDDISRFMDEALARRGQRLSVPSGKPGYYEQALRVLGRYMDEQKPHDVFFLEQDNNFVVRLLMTTHAGSRHQLFEFTTEDIERMVNEGPARRYREMPAGTPSGKSSGSPSGSQT
jgi:hypothetical protein